MDPSGVEKRAQRRVEAAIAIRVQGVDSGGESYSDDTTAVEVSRRGLSFLTSRTLTLFAIVTITIPGRGPSRAGDGPSDFFTEAAVVRCNKDEDGLNRVGVRFLGASLPMYSAERE
jgi:hypothetical protein